MTFKQQKNVFEIIPAITYYRDRGGEYSKGTLTICWLNLALINNKTMETKQVTAIDWLFKKITQNGEIRWRGTQYRELFEEAKAMEKEQIIDAYEYGYWRGNNDDDFEPEEYYENPYRNPNNETYGK